MKNHKLKKLKTLSPIFLFRTLFFKNDAHSESYGAQDATMNSFHLLGNNSEGSEFLPSSICNKIDKRLVLLVFFFFASVTMFGQQSTITISTSATSGGSFSGTAPNRVFTPSASTANIQASALVTELLTNNVTINTALIGGTGTGNVTFNTPITAASTSTTQRTFTINAGGSITVSASSAINLTAASLSSNNAGIPATNIVLTAVSNVNIASAITTNGGAQTRSTGSNAGGNAGSVTITGPTGVSINSNLSAVGGTSVGGVAGTNATITINDGSSTVTTGGGVNDGQTAGVISGGAFTKSGTGTFVMAGSNNYTGLTTVSAGVLNIQNATATGTTAGGVTVTANAALEVQGGITVGAEALTLNGTGISSGGALRSVGTGNLTNTWGGAITLGSTARINADSSSTLSIGGITGAGISLSLGGIGNINVTGIIGTTTGGVTDDGPGTVTFSGANTYTGVTTIQQGITVLGANNVFANTSNFVLSGGTFKTGSASTGFSDTVGTLTLSGNFTIALIGSTSHTLTFANSNAAIWGAFTLTITGWTGTAGSSGGGTAGKIIVGVGGLSADQLAKVKFDGYPLGAELTSTGEVVPPSTFFYSKGSLAPQSAANWNTKRDGTGVDAVADIFAGGNVFVVQNSHTMTTSATWSVSGTGSKVIIESGGTLTATSAITLAAATTFQIDNGGTYKHQNTTAWATSIFQGMEVFGNSSTVEINATATTLPTNSTYGNLTLNLTSDPTQAINFSGNLTTINGNLTIQNTQNRDIRLCTSQAPAVTIAGDFSLSGTTSLFSFTSGTGGLPVVTVNGNTTISGGTLDLSVGTATGSGVLNCKGNFTHTGGTITETGTGTANAININGSTAQTIESTGLTNTIAFTVAPTGAGTVEIASGKTFVDAGSSIFTISNTSSATELTVNGTLNRTSSAVPVPTGSLVFSSTGKYISNFATATIPTAAWDATSTLQIDASIADNEFTESFGNVIVNGTSAFNMVTSGSPATIKGKLTMATTGTIGVSNSTTSASTLTVTGDLEINANGNLIIDNSNGTSSISKKIVVGGNYIQSNGTFNLANTNGTITASTRNAQLDVSGNFTHTAGTITETATDADMITRINLLGTSSKTFQSTGQTGNVEIVLNKTGTATNDLVTLSANSKIDYNLTLTDGLLVLSSFNLTLGASTTTITAPGTTASMIVPLGTGEIRRTTTATGSFVYPIGDNTDTLEYTPVTVNVTGGSGFTSSYIGVSLEDAKHANNGSSTHFLTRSWDVSQSGITGCTVTVTGTYTASDVTGTLGSIKSAQLNGTFNQATNPWVKTGGTVLTGTTLTYTGATITSGQVSVFTGITSADPTVSITGGGVTVCKDDAVTLTAVPVGDTEFTYLWSSSLGTGVTATPSTATVGGPTSYTVTVKDSNGISSAASTAATVTVNPNVAISSQSTATQTQCISVAFSPITVTATGVGLTYQWYSNATASTTGGTSLVAANGAQTNSYTPQSTVEGTLYYYCVVSGTCGTAVTSTVSGAFITNANIPASVAIAASPSSTICSGTNVTFTATPTNGGTPTYQWKLNGGNVGTNSATYSNSALANSDAVTVVMTSTATCASSPATSNTVTMTVATPPTVLTAELSGTTTTCSTGSRNLIVKVTRSGGGGQTAHYTVVYSDGSSNTTVSNYMSGSPIAVTPTTTKTYTLVSVTTSSGCSATVSGSAVITVIANPTATTWNGTGWNNGVPTASSEAIISGTYPVPGTTAPIDLKACRLTVTNNATVLIKSGDSVTLDGALVVDAGSFVTFNSGANLLQNGTTNTNSGAIVIKRDSAPLKRLDYTLWSSPVANQQLQAFSPNTLSNRFYSYNTSTSLYQAVVPTATNFTPMNGFLIRSPNTHPVTTPTTWTGEFVGVPNNGDYSMPLPLQNTATGARYNLIGNPYPSAIDIEAFIQTNIDNGSITGTIYFWRKTNGDINGSYMTKTLGGIVGNASILNQSNYNATPENVVQVGQGFFVAGTGSGSVVFTNDMRINTNANRFFRATSTVERNRVWLNIANATGSFSQAMIGYMTGATQGVDTSIDGELLSDGDISLASLIGTTSYAIQGRALPFEASDVVPMSFKVTTAGDYTITIDHVDGLFSNGGQNVYLRDNTTGIVHDLSAGGYTFSSASGTFATRFEIVYQAALGVTTTTFNESQVVIYKTANNEISINTGNIVMSKVKIFDITGRLLQEQKGINATQTLMNAGLSTEILLVQITSEDGVVVTKKMLFPKTSLKLDKNLIIKTQLAEDE